MRSGGATISDWRHSVRRPCSGARTNETEPLTMIKLHTNYGVITVNLFEDKAPETTANFKEYVKSGHYDSTIFHRVISNFMIQGGGFEPGMKQRLPARRSRTRPTTACRTKPALWRWRAPWSRIRHPRSSSST